MNRARQDSITTEIMEIVGGAEALRQAGAERRRPARSTTSSADPSTTLQPIALHFARRHTS